MEIETPQISNDENVQSETSPSNQNTIAHTKVEKYKTENGLFWFLIAFGMIFLVFTFVFQIYFTSMGVRGISMQPTINASALNDEDELHCDVVYFKKQDDYFNNNVVIIENPNSKYIYSTPNEPVDFLIKRVIATGGQKIKFYAKNLYKPLRGDTLFFDVIVYDKNGNDIKLDQSYTKEAMKYTEDEIKIYSENHPFFKKIVDALTDTRKFKLEDRTITIEIPENQYFVMGDNRNNSGDSRLFGLVDKEDIMGKVEILLPYGKSIFSSIWNSIFGKNLVFQKIVR